MNRLRLLETIARIGWPALAGLALLALALGLTGTLLRGAYADREAARGVLQEARELAARPPSPAAPAPPSAFEQLARLHAQLPPQQEATHWLNRIFNAAAREHLALARGEYRMIPDERGRIARYEIEMPVRGEYLQVRRFLRGALTGVPHLALEGLQLKREHIGATELDARIRFTLFLREAAP